MSNSLRQNQLMEEELRHTRPFFYILLLALAFVYAISVYENADLRDPARLLPFTFLMVVHALLHWFGPQISWRPRRLAPYLALQVVLVFLLTQLGRGLGLTIGLTLALAGETIGILENWRYSLLAAVGFLALLAVNVALISTPAALPGWLGAAGLMLFFVFVYIELYMRQMNARTAAQQLLRELEEAHLQLGMYARQVETLTRDAERQRMARALHDTLAQGLVGLILQLEGLEAHLEQGDSARVAAIAAQAKMRARTTLAEARQAIDDLRDGESEDLLEAIRREADRFQQATGIGCRLTLPPALILPPETAEHAVRAVAEGLANAARHARAQAVWVSIAATEHHLAVEIGDDGRGFVAAEIPAGHYGLLGLRERARLAGGVLTIKSAPGEGAIIRLQLPLPQQEVKT